MEIKEEELYSKLLCLACLCVGRDVYRITNEKLKTFYTDALDEIPLNKSRQFVSLMVCWECKAILQKCWSFREQVKDSYRILQSYTSENFLEYLHTEVSNPPRLKVHKAESIDVPPSGNGDYCEGSTVEVKGELDDNWKCSDVSLNGTEQDCHSDTFDNDTIDNGRELETELQTIICSIEKEDKKRTRHVKSKAKRNKRLEKRVRVRKDLQECTASDISSSSHHGNLNTEFINNGPLDTEKHFETASVDVKDDVEDNWNFSKDGNTDSLKHDYLSDTFDTSTIDNGKELDKEIQTIICSIEREDKMRNRVKSKMKKTKKIVKSLTLQKKRQKYNPKVLTIELSYEEMLLERERESTRETYTKAEYKCDSCLIGFNYKKSFQAHLNSKHSPELGEYICPICKTIISSVDSFTTHYKRHMRRYECSICRKRTMDLKVMQQHYYSTHEIALKEYKCNICGKISNSIDAHRYHKDSHKARVECTECDKTFRHRAGLMNHRLAVHEFHNAFPCTVCEKVFRWKTSLKRHLEKHDVKKSEPSVAPYCSMCSISFSSICSYQRHMKNSLKHVTQDQLKFICDHCNKRFSDKTKLRDHIEEKHLYKTYQCQICLKPSKNRVGLDQHIRNVHKGRPKNKICHHCGRGFPTKLQLESHIRTHTGERPFICEYCPTTFSQKSNLYKHNRQVHLNIKSKRYPICKKRKDENPDQGSKIPIISSTTIEGDPYRPIVLQYSPDRSFVL